MAGFYQKFIDSTKSGVVEIVNIYDYRYGYIFVDGKFVKPFADSSGCIQAFFGLDEIKKISGLNGNGLSFYFVEWESYGFQIEKNSSNFFYDSNDFSSNLNDFFNFINNHNNIVNFDSQYFSKIASSEDEFKDLAKDGVFGY